MRFTEGKRALHAVQLILAGHILLIMVEFAKEVLAFDLLIVRNLAHNADDISSTRYTSSFISLIYRVSNNLPHNLIYFFTNNPIRRCNIDKSTVLNIVFTINYIFITILFARYHHHVIEKLISFRNSCG
jgi:hypothetical protein